MEVPIWRHSSRDVNHCNPRSWEPAGRSLIQEYSWCYDGTVLGRLTIRALGDLSMRGGITRSFLLCHAALPLSKSCFVSFELVE